MMILIGTCSTKLNVNDNMEMKNEILVLSFLLCFMKILSCTILTKNNPLGLYYFGNKKSEQNFVINNTRSGG